MAILQIRPRDPSGERSAPVTITLCDFEGRTVDGFVTATGEAIVKSWTGRTSAAGVLDVDLTPNADITPSQTGYRVTIDKVSVVIVKGSATENVYGALAVGLGALGPIVGAGFPTGGAAGDVMVKLSATNYDAAFQTPTALSALPSGSTPTATDTVVGVQGGAAVRLTCAQLVATVTGPFVSTGAVNGFETRSGTASHGGFIVSATGFGTFASIRLNTADAQPGLLLAATGMQLGPGGATAPNWFLTFTSTALATITGSVAFTAGSSIRATTTGAGLQIGSASNQLIGKWGSTPVARPGGWTAATGTATRTSFDTATVTLSQLAERVKALIDDNFTRGDHGA